MRLQLVQRGLQLPALFVRQRRSAQAFDDCREVRPVREAPNGVGDDAVVLQSTLVRIAVALHQPLTLRELERDVIAAAASRPAP